MTSFADGGTHLSLTLFTWLLEMPVFAKVRQNTGFLALLFEPL
jgi:hypothetical protein